MAPPPSVAVTLGLSAPVGESSRFRFLQERSLLKSTALSGARSRRLRRLRSMQHAP